MAVAKVNSDSLLTLAKEAVCRGTDYAWEIAREDGHWYGELLSNVAVTAEQIFVLQTLAKDKGFIPDADKYKQYIISEQRADGSWSIAPDQPGDISTSCEAYLALKILGLQSDSKVMARARNFIKQSGGVEKIRVFTRLWFAQFGLLPWAATPQLPPEFILLPASAPANIYNLSSWARVTIIPLLLIAHHRPIYALPNGCSKENAFLDELWLNPANKMVPLGPQLSSLWATDRVAFFFRAVDRAIYWLGSLRRTPLRSYARQQCLKWILEHQEASGDWAGIILPMHAGVLALMLEGYSVESRPVCTALEAIERFTWQDKGGKRLQPSVSPVWDTVLMLRALCDSGVVEQADPRLQKVVTWVKMRQNLGSEGDWKVYKPEICPGGFSFQYHNSWYPDVDDTAAVVLALLRQNPSAIESTTVFQALSWICGMQNKDGGWAAFDFNNDKLWLNKIPFSDMNALCDPSSADVTGRVVEAFGLFMRIVRQNNNIFINPSLRSSISSAITRAIAYLLDTQESNGSWYGRWGVNYVYGTSNVLCGLSYWREFGEEVWVSLVQGSNWLRTMQNEDGGWGESVQTYQENCELENNGRGPSTPSQSAWAIMGLLTTLEPSDDAIIKGINYLVCEQTDIGLHGKSWPERLYTGTGFPNFFHLGYTLYRHYFPMMALGRYVEARKGLEVSKEK